MRRVFKVLFAIGPLFLGLACAGTLWFLGQSEPEQVPAKERVALVDIVHVVPSALSPKISGTGVVEATESIDLVPQVNAQVIALAPRFRAGRAFREGEIIARLDPTVYTAAVTDAESRIATAEQDLALERGRGQVAQGERGVTGLTLSAEEQALVFREPQLRTARAELRSAEAALKSAQRDLGLTSLRAPFDAVLVEESLDVGQVVSAGATVGRLLGDSAVQVKVALPLEALTYIALPNASGEGSSEATLRIVGAPTGSDHRGRVMGTTGEIDATTRTASVWVEVALKEEDRLLLPGAFVEVVISGRELPETFRIPEGAVRPGSRVWLLDAQDRLVAAEIEVLWRERGEVLAQGELPPDCRVVTSPLGSPSTGQLARVADAQ